MKFLPLKDAIRLPFLISRKVLFLETRGKVKIDAPIKTGMIQIGYGKVGIFETKLSRSIWLSGKVNFKGRANIVHGTKFL